MSKIDEEIDNFEKEFSLGNTANPHPSPPFPKSISAFSSSSPVPQAAVTDGSLS